MDWNAELFYLINNELQNPVFDVIMPIFTHFGGFVSLLAICIIAIIILKRLKKEKYLKIAKLCLFALIIAGLISAGLKILVQEPRPYTILEHARQLIIPTEPNSFPSGHTASSLSIITVLVTSFKQNNILVALLILFGFLIGFSRIYVGVHYPFDVIAGAVVGVLSGVVVLKYKRKDLEI